MLPFDATADQVERALEELDGVGDVAVTKSAPDALGRATWAVTFLEVSGDVPRLAPTSSLTGAGAGLVVEERTRGNHLGGSFALGFGEYLTAALPYDADAAAVKSAIEALPGAGDVYVARSAAGSEGGAVGRRR